MKEKPRRVASGRQWEIDVFGYLAPDALPPKAEHFGQYEYAKAMSEATQKAYGWDPTAPHTFMGRELFECIQSYLEGMGKNSQPLRMYCCLGSSLDGWGVDGFFELNGSVATFDLTANPEKKESGAQIIFYWSERGAQLWRVAERIANLLIERKIEIYGAD